MCLDEQEMLQKCIVDKLKDTSDDFKVFARKYTNWATLTGHIIDHNLKTGHKLFVDLVEHPRR